MDEKTEEEDIEINNIDNSKLPVYKSIDLIKETITDIDNQVIIISGSTGSGKSTQIPQIIFNLYYNELGTVDKPVTQPYIVCTQPRKVACRNIAKRVALELSESYGVTAWRQLGELVGYQVKDEEVSSQHTRIKFVTTGVLLNSIVNNNDLRRYSHIIIDEVHERSEDIDFLLCLIRQVIWGFKGTKLIIMSATVDEQKFACYFNTANIYSSFMKHRQMQDRPEIYAQMKHMIRKSDEDYPSILLSKLIDQNIEYEDVLDSHAHLHALDRYNSFEPTESNYYDCEDASHPKSRPNSNQSGVLMDPHSLLCPIIYLQGQHYNIELIWINNILTEIDHFYKQYMNDHDHLYKNVIYSMLLRMKCKEDLIQKNYMRYIEKTCANIKRMKEFIERQFSSNQVNLSMEDLFYEIILEILKYIEVCNSFSVGRFNEKVNVKRSVLVFMPGILEINQLKGMILAAQRTEPSREEHVEWYLWAHVFKWLKPVCIHSTMTREEQDLMFASYGSSARKVIIATNIAESSITIQDVAFVIDSCYIKDNEYDYNLGMNRLKMKFTSKASLKQRMGRTGRLEDGFCIRMMTETFYDNCLNNYNDPEILRCQLERIVLKTKISKIGEPLTIVQDLIDKPTDTNLSLAFKNLINYGALSHPSLEHPSGEVTKLGVLMGMMPCDISLTKLIVTGYTLGTLHEAIAIAAVLSTDRDLFINSYSQYKAIRDNARKTFKDIWVDFNENDLKQDDVFDCYKYRAKLDFDNEILSDHITSLRVFYEWLDIRYDLKEQMKQASFSANESDNRKGKRKGNSSKNDMYYEEYDWALHNLVNLNTLKQVWEQYIELSKRLRKYHFVSSKRYKFSFENATQLNCLRIAITSAFLDKLSSSTVDEGNYSFDKTKKHYAKLKNEEEVLQLAYTRAPKHLLRHFEKDLEANLYKVIFKKSNRFTIDFNTQLDDLITLKFQTWTKKDIRTLLYRNDYIDMKSRNYKRKYKSNVFNDFNCIEVDLDKIYIKKYNKVYHDLSNYMNYEYATIVLNKYHSEDRNPNSIKKLVIKLNKLFYPYVLIFILEKAAKKERVDNESVCSNYFLTQAEYQQFVPQLMVSSVLNEKNNLTILKNNTILPENFNLLPVFLHLIYDNYIYLKYDRATMIYSSIRNNFDETKIYYYLDNNDIGKLNFLRKYAQEIISNNTPIEKDFIENFMFLLDKKLVKIDKEFKYLLTLRNYWIDAGHPLNDLLQHSNVDTVAMSKEYKQWIKKRNEETEEMNSMVLDRHECLAIDTVDDILQVDEQLIQDLYALKERIKRQRQTYIHLQEGQKLLAEYKSLGDMDVICTQCLKPLFKFKTVLGLNQYQMLGLKPFEGSHLVPAAYDPDPQNMPALLLFWHNYFSKAFPEDYKWLAQYLTYLLACPGCNEEYGVVFVEPDSEEGVTMNMMVPPRFYFADEQGQGGFWEYNLRFYDESTRPINSKMFENDNELVRMIYSKMKEKMNYGVRECFICEKKNMNMNDWRQHLSSKDHINNIAMYENVITYGIHKE